MESLFDYLSKHGNDLTDHDLAHLADWATSWKDTVSNSQWKRAYALIREGADLLLRRRAMSSVRCDNHMWRPAGTEETLCTSHEAGIVCGQPKSVHTKEAAKGDVGMDHVFTHAPIQAGVVVDYLELRKQIGDWISTFYGPHACVNCGEQIVKQAVEHGSRAYQLMKSGSWELHYCATNVLGRSGAKHDPRAQSIGD